MSLVCRKNIPWSNDQHWQTLGLISKPVLMASVTQMQRPVTSKASKNSQLGKRGVVIFLTETQTRKKGCEGQFEGIQQK